MSKARDNRKRNARREEYRTRYGWAVPETARKWRVLRRLGLIP